MFSVQVLLWPAALVMAILAAIIVYLAFVAHRSDIAIDSIAAQKHAQRLDYQAQIADLEKGNKMYKSVIDAANVERLQLQADLADRDEWLQSARTELKAWQMHTVEMPEVVTQAPIPKRPAPKRTARKPKLEQESA